MKSDGAFVAVMETEHFSFHALGRTEDEAKRAVAEKFHELATERMTIRQLEEHYGLYAVRLGFGEAVRI